MKVEETRDLLTEKDIKRLGRNAAKHFWGFSTKRMKAQIDKYKNGTRKDKAEVLYLLEDCNFHDFVSLLEEDKIDAAYERAETL